MKVSWMSTCLGCDGLTLPALPYPWGTAIEEIPDPDVLRSVTNQVELRGDEGQKEALCTGTRGIEEQSERERRDGESNSGSNDERDSSSDGGSKGSNPREREGGGRHGDGRGEKGRGSPSGSLKVESGTGRRGGKPGGSSPDPGHVLGRAWPQQVCGAELT
ncbi:hypothetical protein NDU88_005523 [Pleurodeles waltl]|uniref:Uncharacterized protein n=1 Tax=Pleurodeles waltl TaxID=8319 RepID=A0AAV7RPB0_PLEWA|nr:hypothetical protein NDU88_005523 [Pleurodeles waltl]